jgi:hypothetical protein
VLPSAVQEDAWILSPDAEGNAWRIPEVAPQAHRLVPGETLPASDGSPVLGLTLPPLDRVAGHADHCSTPPLSLPGSARDSGIMGHD